MSENRPKIVAVDGPAGSGKSSVCAKVAARLGWSYVNTGAIYRAVGLVAAREGVDLHSEDAVSAQVENITRQLAWKGESQRLFYGDEDITDALVSDENGKNASLVAKMSGVREKLLTIQRQWALKAERGAIVDGRDIGTVIFPDADMKVFMIASLDERARRRMLQLGRDDEASLAKIKADINARDSRDAGRDAAPLAKADDAVEFDTTGMDLTKAVDSLAQLILDGTH